MIFLRNLLRSKLRSLMTIVGVATGVSLSVAITAMTIDLREQIDSVSSRYGSEVVISERRATSPLHSRIPVALMQQLVAEFGGDLSPMAIGTLNEAWNPYALLLGAEPLFVRRVSLVRGEPFVPGRAELAIGEIAAQRLGIGPGSTLQVAGETFRVTGVFRIGSRMFDSGLLTDIAQARRLLARGSEEGQYTLAALHVPAGRSQQEVIQRIKAEHPTLTATGGSELAGSLRMIRVARTFVGTISAVAVFGAAVVLVNTLLMSVSERTREIGILMAIGWTPSRVLRLLLAECLVLCLLGALLGNLMALGILNAVNQMPSVGFGWIPTWITGQQVVLSVAGTLGVALLAMLWPGFIVWRMQPWNALRQE